jgi:hypothetical protein
MQKLALLPLVLHSALVSQDYNTSNAIQSSSSSTAYS